MGTLNHILNVQVELPFFIFQYIFCKAIHYTHVEYMYS